MTLRLAIAAVLVVTGCKHGPEQPPPPPKPATGAPIAFQMLGLHEGDRGSVTVQGYNFADKPLGKYTLMLRYKTLSDQILPIHGHDFDVAIVEGHGYRCEPGAWCQFQLDLDVPVSVGRVDILASSATALASDDRLEGAPMFQQSSREWPKTVP